MALFFTDFAELDVDWANDIVNKGRKLYKKGKRKGD